MYNLSTVNASFRKTDNNSLKDVYFLNVII